MSDHCRMRIHYLGTVTSSMDIGFRLLEESRLAEWDSVLVDRQTAGRGQMRRKWISIDRNIFSAVRLPACPPFTSSAAAIATAALIAHALRDLGCDVHLKWPNDLVVMRRRGPFKVAGILVEEKHGWLIAGIGINLFGAPAQDSMTRENSLPAASLNQVWKDGEMPDAKQLWPEIICSMGRTVNADPQFASTWIDLARSFMIWLGDTVTLNDGSNIIQGRFSGIAENGAAMITAEAGTEAFTYGTMRKATE